MQKTMTNFGKRLMIEQRIKDNNESSDVANTTQVSSGMRNSKAAEQFM